MCTCICVHFNFTQVKFISVFAVLQTVNIKANYAVTSLKKELILPLDTYVQKVTRNEVAVLWCETVTSEQNESFSVCYQVPTVLPASLPRLALPQTPRHISELFSIPAATEHLLTYSYTIEVRYAVQ